MKEDMTRAEFLKKVGSASAALAVAATGVKALSTGTAAGLARPATGHPPGTKTLTIYPVEHSMFEKKLTPAHGQTQFTLDVPGPFAFVQAYLEGGGIFEATEGQAEFTLSYIPTLFDTDGDGVGDHAVLVVRVNGEVSWDWRLDGATLIFTTPLHRRDAVVITDYSFYWSGLFSETRHVATENQRAFPIPFTPQSNLLVTVNGLPTTDYTVDGRTLAFGRGLPAGDVVVIGDGIRVSDSTLIWGGRPLTPADRLTVTSYFDPERFIATPRQRRKFHLENGAKNIGFTSVLVNGVQRLPGTYTINANTLTFESNLNPGDQVVVVYGDFDLLQESYAAASDGDHIACSDTDLVGVAKAWMLRRAAGPEPMPWATPSGTFDFKDNFLMIWRYLSISKGVTLTKKPSGAKPVFCDFLTQEEFEETVLMANANENIGGFLVHGNLTASPLKRPRFENLRFLRCWAPTLHFAPYVIDRCDFESCSECVLSFPDNRMTFPHLAGDPGNLGDMLTSEITNCTFKNINWAATNCQGSGMVFAHNTVSDHQGRFSVVQNNGAADSEPAVVWYFFGIPNGDLVAKYNCYNQVFDNHFEGTGAEVLCYIWNGEAIGEGAEAFGNVISSNRFVSCLCWGCVEVGWAVRGGQSYHNEVSGNTFTKCTGPVVLTGDGASMPSQSLITGNRFLDIASALSPSYWPNGSQAVYLSYGKGNKVADNDYSRSGLPGWMDSLNPVGCVLLDEGTKANLVREIGRWPEGTSLCDQISDLTDDRTTDQYDGANRIVGWDFMCSRLSDEQRQRLIELRDRVRSGSQEHQRQMQRYRDKLGRRPRRGSCSRRN